MRRNKDDLLEYGDLRNAIVHDRGKSSVLLADPRESVVVYIEAIWNSLSRPRISRSLALPVPLRIFPANAAVQRSHSARARLARCVLEIGIGSGLNLPFYSRNVKRVIGLDPSPKLLSMARRNLRPDLSPVELIEGSAEATPQRRSCFAAIGMDDMPMRRPSRVPDGLTAAARPRRRFGNRPQRRRAVGLYIGESAHGAASALPGQS